MMRRPLAVAALVIALAFPSSAAAIDRGPFSNGVVRKLGAEVTLHTRRALMAENQAEGVAAANNAYNTTLRTGCSTTFNHVGVQNYCTPEEGMNATVRTLKFPNHGYERIIRAIRNNAPAIVIVRAFGRSDWGTDLALVEAVLRDIQHSRFPNTLANLESRPIPSFK